MSSAHNETVAQLADRRDRQARPEGDAERRQLRADPFPDRQGQDRRTKPTPSSPSAAWSCARRSNYGLPHALRMTIGTEEANRLVVEALARLHGRQVMGRARHRLFHRVALIGFGLIGGSIARAARAQGLAGEIVTTARSRRRARASPSSASSTRWSRPMPEAVQGRRPRHPLHSRRRLRRRSRPEIAAASRSRAPSSPMSAR